MDDIIIRKAVKEDVMDIAEIILEDWQKAYKGIIDSSYLDSLNLEDRYQREVNRYDKYYVAEIDGKVVGCSWVESAEGEADCEIIALYVRYGIRGKGIGKRLFIESKKHFLKEGKKKMIIWCLKDNSEARGFYEKMGGIEGSESTHRWGDRDYAMASYTYDLT